MTGIQWTEETWNPTVGCSLVSPGCTNCYAMKQAARLVKMDPASHYVGTVIARTWRDAVWTGKVNAAPDSIFEKPLRKRKPTLYFVNSMSDLFHEDVEDATIDRVFAIMALRHDHRFQILTKRHERMLAYMTATDLRHRLAEAVLDVCPIGFHIAHLDLTIGLGPSDLAALPLKNVWLGVSVEDQRRADERIPILLQTPAAVRFISAEPLLGPIDMQQWLAIRYGRVVGESQNTRLDWVICGGESGPKARLFNLAWARDLRDQCAKAGVPFFMKQMGSKPVGNSFPFDHPKGGDMEEWPEDLRIRQMPVAA